MHQPVLHVNTEEPSLVPQWLKDGVLKRNGCSTRAARAGAQDTARRTPSVGLGWDSNRSGSQSVLHDNLSEEQARQNSISLGRVQPLKVGAGSKLVNGSTWHSKSRSTDRFSAFERSPNGHERSSSLSHDYWPHSPDNQSIVNSDSRNEWNLTKDFAPRSSLLYSPKQTHDVFLDSTEAPFDKQFPSLHISASHPSHLLPEEDGFPALCAAPGVPSKPVQNWASSLADPPGAAAAGALLNRSAKSAAFPAQNALRMAEALQSANANGASAGTEKAAREQLAVKQSKQLVPVIATNKHKAAGRHGEAKVAPVLDARKEPMSTAARPLDRLGSSERTDFKKPNGMLALKPQTSLKLSSRQPSRTSFFESLRRTSSLGSDSLDVHFPAAEHKHIRFACKCDEHDGAGNKLIPVIDVPEFINQDANCEVASTEHITTAVQSGVLKDHLDTHCDTTQHCNGHPKTEEGNEAQLTPEEEAFLRSLGWTDTSDEDDFALTEEEIAAFQATVGNRKLLPVRPKVSLLLLSPHSSLDQYINSDSDSDSSSDSDIY